MSTTLAGVDEFAFFFGQCRTYHGLGVRRAKVSDLFSRDFSAGPRPNPSTRHFPRLWRTGSFQRLPGQIFDYQGAWTSELFVCGYGRDRPSCLGLRKGGARNAATGGTMPSLHRGGGGGFFRVRHVSTRSFSPGPSETSVARPSGITADAAGRVWPAAPAASRGGRSPRWYH